jgi:hypothetical protein
MADDRAKEPLRRYEPGEDPPVVVHATEDPDMYWLELPISRADFTLLQEVQIRESTRRGGWGRSVWRVATDALREGLQATASRNALGRIFY